MACRHSKPFLKKSAWPNFLKFWIRYHLWKRKVRPQPFCWKNEPKMFNWINYNRIFPTFCNNCYLQLFLTNLWTVPLLKRIKKWLIISSIYFSKIHIFRRIAFFCVECIKISQLKYQEDQTKEIKMISFAIKPKKNIGKFSFKLHLRFLTQL